MQPSALTSWRDRYTAAGLPPIPVRGKRPRCAGHLLRPPPDQWAEVGPDFQGNLAVILGGPESVCVLDCDDSRAVEAVSGHLEGLGASLPAVCTPSGGRHYYFKASGVPAGLTFARLAPEIGKGELRARHCYVVAPASDIGGQWYRFLEGSPEAIGRLRPIRWRDVAPWALAHRQPQQADPLDCLPVRLAWRELPPATEWLLRALRGAPKGVPVGVYPTRSEAEAGVCTTLGLCGWSFADVLALFNRERPGHFAEHARPREYLQRTFGKALGVLAASETRQALAQRYSEASACPWPGRGGGYDRAVYLALLAVCWQFDGFEVEASTRVLSEHAAMSYGAVPNALKRLQNRGLVAQEKPCYYDHSEAHAATWRIVMSKSCAIVTGGSVLCAAKAAEGQASGGLEGVAAELWARSALGKSAALVYVALGSEARLVGELAEATGKHRQTVSKALRRLAAFALAEDTGRGWVRGPASLAEAAEVLDCEAEASLRRARHERQREAMAYAIRRSSSPSQ